MTSFTITVMPEEDQIDTALITGSPTDFTVLSRDQNGATIDYTKPVVTKKSDGEVLPVECDPPVPLFIETGKSAVVVCSAIDATGKQTYREEVLFENPSDDEIEVTGFMRSKATVTVGF